MPVGRHQCEHTSVGSDLWTLDSSWSPVCIFPRSPQEMIWRNLAVSPSSKTEGVIVNWYSQVCMVFCLPHPPPLLTSPYTLHPKNAWRGATQCMATLKRGCTRSLASLSWFGSTPAFLKFSPKMIKYKLQELFTLLVIAGCLLFLFPL